MKQIPVPGEDSERNKTKIPRHLCNESMTNFDGDESLSISVEKQLADYRNKHRSCLTSSATMMDSRTAETYKFE